MKEVDDIIEIFMPEGTPVPPVLIATHKHYTQNNDASVRSLKLTEISKLIEDGRKCIVIFTISSSPGVAEFIQFAKLNWKNIRVKRVVPLVLLKSPNKKIEELLGKSGCAEVLPFNVPLKSLTHKLNRYMKLLEINKAEANDQFEVTDRKTPTEPAAKAGPPMVFTVDPIEARHDFWLLVKKSHAKKYLSNWLVEMIGPSPTAGRWNKITTLSALFPGSPNVWEWVATDVKSFFHTGNGKWIFVGNYPEYNWSINRWGFVGEAAELSYVFDGKVIHSRFKAVTKTRMEIANNSGFATSAFGAIKDTYDRSRSFGAEKSEVPWDEEIADDADPSKWGQGDLSVEEANELVGPAGGADLEETDDFLRNLLNSPGYKIKGILKGKEIELLGFGDESNCIFIGMSEELAKEKDAVELQLHVEGTTKNTRHELQADVFRVHPVEEGRFIAKLIISSRSIDKLDKVKKTFFDRGQVATAFIKKAQGIDSAGGPAVRDPVSDRIQDFLKDNHVIILDSVSSARLSLATSLTKMGANRKKMSLVGSIEQAIEESNKHNARIIFSDYMVGSRSGLGFIQSFKSDLEKQGIRESLAIMVTSNASQSAVARAAEGDIDNFIVKPYPYDNLRKIVLQTLHDILNPNEYLQMINAGKDLLRIDEHDQAILSFKEALPKVPRPALALAYLGKLHVTRDPKQAENYFREALSHNSIHFNSLTGLHDLLFDQRRFEEAYAVARDLVKYFPADPKRLSNVLRASIVTDNFRDIQEYYDVYKEMEERSEELIRYVCSAAVVGGKHFLRKNERSTAMALFEKAATSAAGRTQYLLYIVETLVSFNLARECQSFVKRLYGLAPASEDYLTANYLMSTLTLPPKDVVHQGRELIKKGVHTGPVYEKLIQFSKKEGYQESAEELSREASKRWPEKRELFKV